MTARFGIVASIAGVIAIYFLRLDDAAGLYKDDAYYLVLAQALAQGDGYRLISSATTPIVPSVPPIYALLVAPLFAIGQPFPDNLFWIKLVSILAVLGAGALTYRYHVQHRALDVTMAAVVAFLTMLTPGLVFLATSTTMPECVFLCAIIGAALMIDRAADVAASSRTIVLAGIVTSVAVLTRASGVAMVAAGALVLMRRRGWRTAAGFAAVCALCYAPWLLYSLGNAPTRAQREAHGGSIAYSYAELLQSQSGGGIGEAQLRIGISDVPRRIGKNLESIFAHDIGALIFPAGYRGFEESGLEVFMLSASDGFDAGSMGLGWGAVAVSLLVTAIVLAGVLARARRGIGVAELFCVLTVAMVLIVPSRTYRYVLPLAPFVLAYFLVGIRDVATWIRASAGAPAFRISAVCLAAFLIAEHSAYVWRKISGPAPPWLQDYREVRSVADFVRAELQDGDIVSTNPALVYLLTGRKAVAYVEPISGNWSRWRSEGLRYAVALHAVPAPSPSLGHRLHESSRLKLWVVEIDAR